MEGHIWLGQQIALENLWERMLARFHEMDLSPLWDAVAIRAVYHCATPTGAAKFDDILASMEKWLIGFSCPDTWTSHMEGDVEE